MSQINLQLIRQHIEDLKKKRPPWIDYGGGNPYSYCGECKASIVEGHHDDCSFSTQQELIESLEQLLEKAQK